MDSSTRQYGDLATQLVQESRRSTATDTLLKYNDVLVRSIIREQRQLESLIQETLSNQDGIDPASDPRTSTVMLYQTTILRNKRCLLAYHHHRMERLKDLYWSVGGALPSLTVWFDNFAAVYTLWKRLDLLPFLSTPAAVVPKLIGGADLMMPGGTSSPPSSPLEAVLNGRVSAVRQSSSTRPHSLRVSLSR